MPTKKKAATSAAAEPTYTQVTVVKTDEIDGHVYRRGERPNVDAATLAAMRDREMVAEADA